MTPFERVKLALESAGHVVADRSSFVTTCPAHADSRPSLSVKGLEDKVLLHCFVGCGYPDILEALGLSRDDLGPVGHGGKGDEADLYVYTDEEGVPLTRVIRTQFWNEKKERYDKSFGQERYSLESGWEAGLEGARRVLYNLPAVARARSAGQTIYLVEGEKDADVLALALDAVATTNLGGAASWRPEYADTLRGARVVVVADNDDVGRRAAESRADSLRDLPGTTVQVVLPREGKDATDHVFAGYDLQDFVEVDGLDVFEPLDFESYEPVPTAWLLEPYVPAGSRVLAFGSAGSLKSLWAMWLAAKLANEGRDVAYFSLEMTASETKKRVNQLGLTDAGKTHFKVFRAFDFRSELQVRTATERLRGFALIVVDSWTAAHSQTRKRDANAEVAQLDEEVFLPMVEATGATLLILDNTGHDWWVGGERMKADHARGASAKGDKMDYSLFFSRPDEHDNYCTEIQVQKVRIDYPTPPPITVYTTRDRIEFYHKIGDTGFRGDPLWPASRVEVGASTDGTTGRARVAPPSDTPDSLGGGESSRGLAAPMPPTQTPQEIFAEMMQEARARKYLEDASQAMLEERMDP